jgi:phosphate butyryltransferase
VELPGYHKLLGVCDSGMIPAPDLETKKAILRNAINALQKLGYEKPLISALCAAEAVSPKIIETVDAAALKQACADGELGNCYVEGPISFDLAMNPESAKVKKYESPVVGNSDILLVPSLATGNIMVKTMLLYAGAQMAGAIVGAKCPIALISRSASYEEKYYSLLLCALIS